MKEILIKQINFEYWANTELIASMKKANPLDERALLLFSHLLSSGNMWISRLNGLPITVTLFQERTLAECEELLKINTEGLLKYLQSASDDELNRIINFIFPIDGSQKRIRVYDSILHVVHHSSYHRGQIVTKLKGSIEPLPFVTYIAYATEHVD